MPTTTTPRMMAIAEDVAEEGAHIASASIFKLVVERDDLSRKMKNAEDHFTVIRRIAERALKRAEARNDSEMIDCNWHIIGLTEIAIKALKETQI